MEMIDVSKQRALYEERMGARLQPRAVFFDMDGVLYDSMPAHARSWQETAKAFGLEMSERDVYLFEGQTGGYTIDLLVQRSLGRPATPQEKADLYAHKTRLFTQYNTGALIPNVHDVLTAVASLRRIVVTGSSQASLIDKLEAHFPRVFSPTDLITGRDVRHGKPHPEPYLMAQTRAGVQAYEALVVENAPQGVRAAHDAGCFTIAVNTGPLPDSELWGQGADLVCPDMATLCALLPELLAD